MKKYLIVSFVLFTTTNFLFAVDLKTFVQDAINNVAYTAVSLIISVAVLYFFVGVIKFLYASRDGVEQGLTDGKQAMLWGAISIFILISVFGIVKLTQGVTGIGNATNIDLPALQSVMFRPYP